MPRLRPHGAPRRSRLQVHVSHMLEANGFPFRSPEGRVALVIEIDKARYTKLPNDVPGTDYCIGFSTCVTRTISMTYSQRTSYRSRA